MSPIPSPSIIPTLLIVVSQDLSSPEKGTSHILPPLSFCDGLSICWPQKCDEQRENGSCQTCIRLKIDCLGWGVRRPVSHLILPCLVCAPR